MKILWYVPVDTIDGAWPKRIPHGRYVRDLVVIQDNNGRVHEFQMGFYEMSGGGGVIRDMAEKQAKTAAAEIQSLVDPPETEPVASEPAKSQHSLALVDAGPEPDTEPSDHWTQEDYERLARWMQKAWENKKYQAIWLRRIALGYGLVQRSAAQQEWFWVNALPALAGCELDLRDHPLMATFAGYADQAVDESIEGQQRAMEVINQKFFG
jgi:hypothetical protein